jgi:hypothetical protein
MLYKINKNNLNCLWCIGKKWLFWLCRRVGLWAGQSQMSHLCGGVFYFFLGRIVCCQVGLLVCFVFQRNCQPSLGRLKSLVRMSKSDCFGVRLMVVVSTVRLAYNTII